MSKAIIVTDFAYKGPQRKGYGTGHQGLSSTLKYLQYRDKEQNRMAQDPEYERWQDHGLGIHWRDIHKSCSDYQSQHVLAWTWVISPAPDLMELIPEDKRRDLVCDLTEAVVEDYYLERGFDIPEFSYILHDRETEATEGEETMQHLHTHVILPGTAPTIAERQPIYNNKERGHDALFRDVASRHFAEMLDDIVGPEWRLLREEPEIEEQKTPDLNNLDTWFTRD